METNLILHILRNPYGWSEEEKREARLAAADEIERLQRACEIMLEIARTAKVVPGGDRGKGV